jgi:hypothetical protein
VCGEYYDTEDLADFPNGLSTISSSQRDDFIFGFGCPSCGFERTDENYSIDSNNNELVTDHYQALVKNNLQIKGVCAGRAFSSTLFGTLQDAGDTVVEEDWDNLIILDAARYDMFVDNVNLQGATSKRLAVGSHSLDFVNLNFSGRELHDTVCVTANGWYSVAEDLDFYQLVELYTNKDIDERRGTALPQSCVDSYTGAILAEAVADATLAAHVDSPNKRLVAHFMQPHIPYIPHTHKWGSTDDRILLPKEREFTLAKESKISLCTLRSWYVDNLLYVVSTVESLLDKLNGKTVITADHGENLGEVYYGERQFGHSVHTDMTRYVPYHEIPCTSRRDVSSSSPQPASGQPTQFVLDNLSAYGYLD